jgi:hypothetical protein
VADLLTPKQRSAIARAIQKPELRPILFRKAVGVHWFNAFEEAGFLSPTDIPPPAPAKEEGYVNIPVWPITDYLVASSVELRDLCNEGYAKRFLEFIRAATLYAMKQRFGNYRAWWQFSKIVRNIPPHLIDRTDSVLIDYWLDDKYERGLVGETLGKHWLADLLDRNDEHCKTLAMALLKLLYKVMFIDKRYGATDRKEAILRFDDWHAKKITQKVAPKAGRVLGRDAVEVFRGELELILSTLENDRWSSLWRSAIEDHEQNHAADDAKDILVEGMRDSLLAFVNEAPTEAKNYVLELLKGPFETIKRIAIYCIDQRYQQLGELARQVLADRYFTSNFRHELWHLLHNHYRQLSGPERALVRDTIGCLVQTDEDGRQNDGATAYTRAIWLKAIHEYGDDEGRLYQECVDVVGGEPEHPDFSSYMTSGWVDHKSPIPKDDLLSMDVDELVKRLDSYRDPGKFREPGLEGLAKALRQVVKAAPTRYFTQLHKFSGLDLAYVYELLEAYGELWTENAQLPWQEIWQQLLAFCEEVIQQFRFWSEESAQKRDHFVANRYWVVGSIGRLIENGTRSDEHAFSEQYLDQAQAILNLLLQKEKGEEFKPDSDAVSISINSPRGRCLEAFINLSLRSCRLADKRGGAHIDVWKNLEPTYNAELARADIGEYEFATLVVNYLPNFLYMSQKWVLANLSKIFDQENYQRWLCALNGYAYVGTVYEDIYDHLKKQGHFIRALNDENLKDRVAEKIVQNIAIAFINDFENLDDEASLLHQLLERKEQEELSQLIWFIWTLRKEGDAQVQSKVFELWPRLLAVIDTSSRDGKKLASRLSTWSVFIDEVNDMNKPLILTVASYAEEDYNAHDLLEMIARTSKVQPREAYEIWLKLLERTCTDFPEEAVRTALKTLAKSSAEGMRQAKDIVSAYLKSGNERPSNWLKELANA